jgi:hypothetical protein
LHPVVDAYDQEVLTMNPYSILFREWFRRKSNAEPIIDNKDHEALSDAFEAGYGWGWKMHSQECLSEEDDGGRSE